MIIKVKKYRWIDGYRNDNEAEKIAEWEMLTDSPNRCISNIEIDQEWEFLRWEHTNREHF